MTLTDLETLHWQCIKSHIYFAPFTKFIAKTSTGAAFPDKQALRLSLRLWFFAVAN